MIRLTFPVPFSPDRFLRWFGASQMLLNQPKWSTFDNDIYTYIERKIEQTSIPRCHLLPYWTRNRSKSAAHPALYNQVCWRKKHPKITTFREKKQRNKRITSKHQGRKLTRRNLGWGYNPHPRHRGPKGVSSPELRLASANEMAARREAASLAWAGDRDSQLAMSSPPPSPPPEILFVALSLRSFGSSSSSMLIDAQYKIYIYIYLTSN